MKKIDDDDIKKAFQSLHIPPDRAEKVEKAAMASVRLFAELKKNKKDEIKSKGVLEPGRLMGKIKQLFINLKGEPIMTRTQLAGLSIATIAVVLTITIQTTSRKPVILPDHEISSIKTGKKTPAHERQPGFLKPGDSEKSEPALLADHAPSPSIELQEERHPSKVKGSKENRVLSFGRSPITMQDTGRVFGKAKMEAPAGARGIISGLTAEPDTVVPPGYQDVGRDRFEKINANPIKLASEEPVSTFSVDVDTASYAFVRRQLNSGVLPQKNAVRIEEMINYFDYNYPLPQDKTKPFEPTLAVYPCPWNKNTRLLHIGIKGYDIAPEKKPRSNLVFLLDVSGSMNNPDKLPLLKNSMKLLVDHLDPDDTVAITVYAGAAGTVLEPTKVQEKGKIIAALDRLQAGGSTAGAEGIKLAYLLAAQNFDKEAVNRVILATDGDFNVGITDQEELKSYIERQRESGIFLSILGFGQGNYNDALMQTLAQNGNGNAAYIDSLNEARKVLVDEASATLFPIAKDVKIQVEFNPARVNDYRLIGYETRILKREDFNNDKVDAAEIGSGHTVTAIYEITPADAGQKRIDPLRYRTKNEKTAAHKSTEIGFLKIRYKLPNSDTSTLITRKIDDAVTCAEFASVNPEMRFAAAVAGFGQLLRQDPYTKDFSYKDVIAMAKNAKGTDEFGYRSEFINLVRLAASTKSQL